MSITAWRDKSLFTVVNFLGWWMPPPSPSPLYYRYYVFFEPLYVDVS